MQALKLWHRQEPMRWRSQKPCSVSLRRRRRLRAAAAATLADVVV